MSLLPPQITKVIEEFSKLPGIGPRSAERLTFHLLRSGKANPEALGKALLDLKRQLTYCRTCQMVALTDECEVCRGSGRDCSQILVVEDPLDVVAFEKIGYRGLYHVLHGSLSPLDGVGPDRIKAKELVERVRAGGVREIVLATDPDTEGEATALYLAQILKPFPVKLTRIAHGVPLGGDLDYLDERTLSYALSGRREV